MQTIAAQFAAPSIKRHDIAAVARSGTAAAVSTDMGQRIADRLRLLEAVMSPKRRIVHAGDVIYRSGETFSHLYVLHSGLFKLISVSPDPVLREWLQTELVTAAA